MSHISPRCCKFSCVCKTSVTESVVFTDTSNVSKEDVMSQLFIGALGPPANSVPENLGVGLVAHKVGGIVDGTTVFQVEDKSRTMYVKNLVSTVNLQGWAAVPEIYEAEGASLLNNVVSSAKANSFLFLNAKPVFICCLCLLSVSILQNVTASTIASGGSYVEARYGNETSFIEWNVNVEDAGKYLISMRYAHDLGPRGLQVGA